MNRILQLVINQKDVGYIQKMYPYFCTSIHTIHFNFYYSVTFPAQRAAVVVAKTLRETGSMDRITTTRRPVVFANLV